MPRLSTPVKGSYNIDEFDQTLADKFSLAKVTKLNRIV